MTSKTKIMFFGNPGVGKSTLINSLLGKKGEAKSGVSKTGSGITTEYATYTSDTLGVLLDTPGLDDVKTREKACQEITKALKTTGSYKLIFLLTMESGRLRGSDVATVSAVMEAVDCPYSIIVTKLPKKQYKEFKSEGSVILRELLSTVGEELKTDDKSINILNPAKILGLARDDDLEEASDELYPKGVVEEVINFIEACPSKFIEPTQVKDVKSFTNKMIDELNEKIKEQQKEMENLRSIQGDIKFLQQLVEKQQKEIEKLVQKQQEEIEKSRASQQGGGFVGELFKSLVVIGSTVVGGPAVGLATAGVVYGSGVK